LRDGAVAFQASNMMSNMSAAPLFPMNLFFTLWDEWDGWDPWGV